MVAVKVYMGFLSVICWGRAAELCRDCWSWCRPLENASKGWSHRDWGPGFTDLGILLDWDPLDVMWSESQVTWEEGWSDDWRMGTDWPSLLWKSYGGMGIELQRWQRSNGNFKKYLRNWWEWTLPLFSVSFSDLHVVPQLPSSLP